MQQAMPLHSPDSIHTSIYGAKNRNLVERIEFMHRAEGWGDKNSPIYHT